MEVKLSEIRIDLAAVLRKEEERLTAKAHTLRVGSAARGEIQNQLEIIERQLDLLENEPEPLRLKIEREIPKGRLRL